MDVPTPRSNVTRLRPVPSSRSAAGAPRARVHWLDAAVDGRTVRYAHISPVLTAQHAHAPAQRPLVWIHGWAVSPVPYLPSLRAFAAQTGRTVIAFALPGFGGSAPLPLRQQGVAGIAAHLIAAIENLDLPGQSPDGLIDLAGHSFGGALSLRIGALRPDIIGSLSLYCPAGGSHPAIPLPKVFAGIAADGFHRWTPAALGVVLPNIGRHPAAFLGSGLAAWRSDQIEDIDLVSDHGISTIFVFAESDGVVTPGTIPSVDLPGVHTEWVPGRHSWLLTDPADFVAMLKRHQVEHTSVAPAAALG